MSLYKQFKTDENCEKNGIWLEYSHSDDNGKPVRIKIARAGGSNIKYLKTLEMKSKPYRRQLQNDTLDITVADEMLKEVYADSVILGWENVTDDKGVELPFNRINCLKLLSDLPDLFADIREQSTRAALFRADLNGVTIKN